MRTARVQVNGEPRHARVVGDATHLELALLDGDPIDGAAATTGERIRLADSTTLLAPLAAISKVVCMGKNYDAHAREVPDRGPASDLPILFFKPSSTVIGPGAAIVLPDYSSDVQLEAELAVVIGRHCKDVAVDDAADFIYGYTCANDVTARDLQRREDQWFRAKAFDTSLPLGPWIETELDPSAIDIRSRINGEEIQCGNTRDMIRSVAEAVAMASEVATLFPGDVVITGTPSGVTTLHDGDLVEVDIEGIGSLANPVIRA